MATIDRKKQELAAQLHAVIAYYELNALQIDLRAAQFEVTVLESQVKDSKQLRNFGLASKKELEQIEQRLAQQKLQVTKKQGSVNEKMDSFKMLLGFTKAQQIMLPSIEEMKLKGTFDYAIIDIKQQYDYKKAEAALTYANERKIAAEWENPLLRDYLEIVVEVETDRKNIVSSWLEQKKQALYTQKESLSLTMTEINNKLALTKRELSDYKKLYAVGKITEREVDAVNQDLVRIQLTADQATLNQFIWQEKMRVAQLGMLE